MHGLNAHSGTWRKNIVYLSREKRILPPSLPTTRDPIGSVRIEKYVEQVDQFLGKVGVEQASFIGNSMGGWISTILSTERSEPVRSLVLEDTAGISESTNLDGMVKKIVESKTVKYI